MQDRIPYTYLIGWTVLDKWYYGVRYRKGCHPSDLWAKYFTSSPIVEAYRVKFGEPDVIQVRRIFNNTQLARYWEDKVHHRMNVVKSSKWLNLCYGNTKFKTDGHFCGKTLSGEIIWVSKNDPRVVAGEIVGIQFNTVTVRDRNGETRQVSRNDTKYISGELVSISTGFGTAYEKKKKKCVGRIPISDPRWISGEVVGSIVFAEKVTTTIGMLAKNDPRLVSGEAQHTNAKNAPAICNVTGKKLGRISIDDPRWVTGDIVSMSKDFIAAKDFVTKEPLGNIHKTDLRWVTGDIVALSKDTIMAKDAKTGVSVGRVEKTDPRWISGEVVGIKKKLPHL